MNSAPATFQNNFRESSFMHSTTPFLHVIMKPVELSGRFTIDWIMGTTESLIFQNKLFLIVSVIATDNLFEPKGNVSSLELIKLCFSPAEWLPLQRKQLTGIPTENMFATSEEYPSPNDLLEVIFNRPDNNIGFDQFIS